MRKKLSELDILRRSVRILEAMPEGWRRIHGSSAPRGYAWIKNALSDMDPACEHALLKL